MDKMWAGRFSEKLNELADDFNSSLHFDCRMYKQDIKGSMAHAEMLASKGAPAVYLAASRPLAIDAKYSRR